MSRVLLGLLLLACVCVFTGCTQQMAYEPRYDPLAASDFFPDGMSARPRVEGTVARGELHANQQLNTGMTGKEPSKTFPFPVTRQVLERGQERYGIYCSPCHGTLGDGYGVVVQRGLRAPPSYHIPRLREAPPGHFFDVITNGFGAMASYGARITPRDRWAIIVYIRALQLSQNATLADVPPPERLKLTEDRK